MNLDINEVKEKYIELGNLHQVAKFFHTSHLVISKLLRENGIKINNIGKRREVDDEEIKEMITDYTLNNLTMENISVKYHIRIKKLRKIFKDNNVTVSKWHNHNKREKVTKSKLEIEYKHCPYCDWKTRDITGEKHSFARHIKSKHKITLKEHLEKYPEDKEIIGKSAEYEERVECPICGKKLFLIDSRHLQRVHGISKDEFTIKYKNLKIIADTTKEKLQQCMQLMQDNPNWERQTSKYESEIEDFFKGLNINYIKHDRNILDDKKEIDFYLQDFSLGIEFNGNLWHTEFFGHKDKNYHVNKLNQCNNKGIRLIHIFEDEYVLRKNIVLSKIKHTLGFDDRQVIQGRHTTINVIDKNTSYEFLEKYHIQGGVNSTISYGAFYNGNLIGVMSFLREKEGHWNLVRFATDINYRCQGIGGKLYSRFVKENKPVKVKSFADRRWTLDKENNIYTKLGFDLVDILKPDYRYYNEKINKLERKHKFNFRKQILHRKYNLPLTMTELEMAKELGYDRIWDCGLFKYVWTKKDD